MPDGTTASSNEDEANVSANGKAGAATSARARIGIAVAALAFYAIFLFRTSFSIGGTRYFVLFEDAMISMRYAEHLAHGQGLTWNVGEPPIEGFTNLLWVLWMSVAHLTGMSESKISLFIMLSGVAIMMGLGIVVTKIARRVSDAAWVPVAALAATLFCYPLVFWTLRGMEVGALALFVYTLLWLVLENEDAWSTPRAIAMGALTAGAILIRSDSVIAVGLICAYGFFFSGKKRWLFAGIIGGFACTAVGAQMLSRERYFHEALPNTYYLKLYHIPLSARLKRGVFVALEVLTAHLAVPIAVVLASVTGFDRAFWKDKQKRRLALLGAVFAAQIAYAMYVGGDAWEWMLYANRYTCVGMPALVVLSAALLSRVAIAGRERHEDFAKKLSIVLAASGLLLLLLQAYAKARPEHGIAATITFSKKAFAIGGALVFAGALLRLRDLREAIPAGFAALKKRLSSRVTVVPAALIVTALVWLPAHALPLGQWAAHNAAQYADEARYTRLGLLIRETTPPDLRIAVAAAGATPYFAQRPTEDLLGKNDRHVAKLPPKGVFSPGHDKWDYPYSLGERKSDLVVEPVDMTPADEAYFASLGFEKLPNEMRLRRDAPVPPKEREVLGRDVPDAASLVQALADVGRTLPGSSGVDFAVVLAFGLVIAVATRKLSRDVESYAELSPEPPAHDEPDEAQKAALAGADARSIPTLDGMRGIAVLLVLGFHFAWTFPGEDPAAATTALEKIATRIHAALWSGWTGVDLFFVLSGYLITRGLVTPSGKVLGQRMKSFWMRRVLRIFPLYYAVVIVGTIVCLVAGGWIPTAPYWLYMQNYALAFDTPDQALKWVAHFWSLAIEEQFYFVWPLVALTVPRKKLIPAILALICAVVVVRAGLVFKAMSIPSLHAFFGDEEYVKKFVYRATFTRADGLLLGAFVAVTQREVTHPIAHVWRRLRFPLWVSSGVALGGLYVLANGLNDYDRRIISVGYFALALFFATTVSLCADGKLSERARRFLSWRPLVSCGKVSYGMYIFHWPLVALLVPWLERTLKGMPVGAQLAMSIAVIVVGTIFVWGFASLSFRYFETPFLQLKKRFHD
jgi:peptidoglycan/LPS O-acetylase OafA/YrhL